MPSLIIFSLILFVSGCTSLSAFHAPTTNGKGHLQTAIGVTGRNSFVVTSLDASYGVADQMDIGIKLESGSGLAFVQYQALSHEGSPLDLSLLLGVGKSAVTDYQIRVGVIGGRKYQKLEPYIGFLHHNARLNTEEIENEGSNEIVNRFFDGIFDALDKSSVNYFSIPIGMRWHMAKHFQTTFEIQQFHAYTFEKAGFVLGGLQAGLVF